MGWPLLILWMAISAAWLVPLGLAGLLIASGGLAADGPTATQRLGGSVVAGLAFSGPVVALLVHPALQPHVRRVVLAGAVVGALGAAALFVLSRP